jgi:hypothetical protein
MTIGFSAPSAIAHDAKPRNMFSTSRVGARHGSAPRTHSTGKLPRSAAATTCSGAASRDDDG